MGLPKIDTPVYEIELPISKKKLKFRPFLVKEQKNLLMAYEADDAETINSNIKQILLNCIIDEKIDIDEIPIVDIEYYFLNLRARSVGEVVETKYKCENKVDDKVCGNVMETSFNVLDVDIELLKKVGELCSKPDLQQENLTIEVKPYCLEQV